MSGCQACAIPERGARAVIADMQVSGDGEQPGAERGIGPEPPGVSDEPQPGFLEQVFGHLPAPSQPQQEGEERPACSRPLPAACSVS